MVQAGRRAVYEPAALAFERPTPTNEAEYARKVRMFEHCWEITLRGSMLRRLPPGYLVSVISHRLLRYGSGVLHLALLGTSLVLAPTGWPYALALLGQLAVLAAFAAGVPIARYYVYVTWATVQALWNYLRRGVPATWDAAEGTRVNRSLDVALAGLGLVVASPLLAVAALAAKLEDGGPVLFRQVRVGKDGKDFELLKLRSMVVDAERQGAGFAVDRGDARITRVGRVIRRTSIDELPQLWNVVRGDMSVIGPRPTLRYQVERYTERQRRRLEVLPGLTGWAQIHGRTTLPWAERIELDVWYVEHRSPRVDLKILLRTPIALLGGTYKGTTGGWRAEE